MPNPDFMNGIPELLILRLLEGREMYGYELVQEIRTATAHVISLGEGVVYPELHALERAGALKSRRKKINGRTRVYYTVTNNGTKRLQRLAEQWSRITDAIENIVREPKNVQTA